MKTTFLTPDSKRLLGMVFGADADEAWISWLGNMRGARADVAAPPADFADTYFSVGLMGAGAHTREIASCISVHALVIDDVGTKIDRGAMKMLAPVPDWALETSVGNWQWGYVIDGGCTVAEFDDLRRAMKGNPIWGHSDGIDAVHLFRLPQGVNSKRGGKSFPVAKIVFPKVPPRGLDELYEAFAGAPAAAGAPGAPSPGAADWTLGAQALQELVDLIPHPPELDRDEWIRVMHGIMGAGGDFEVWESFSERWDAYDAADTRKRWDTATPENVRSRGGNLRAMAQAGDPSGFDEWRAKWEAPAVFDDGVDHVAAAGAPAPPAGAVGVAPVQGQVAQAIIRAMKGAMRFNLDSACWHLFSGGIWRVSPSKAKEGFLRAEEWARVHGAGLGKAAFKEVTKAGFYDGVENILRQRLAIRQDAFDRDPWLLGTPDGTVDLRTGRMRPADLGDFISKSTAVKPWGTCPRWVKFVAEICKGDLEAQRFLQQWLGYCLTGDTSEQVFLFLYGPGGNGKSVLMDTAAGIMGDYFRKPVADLYFAKASSRHMQEVAMLAGARCITVSEVPPNAAWDEGKLKDHTGGGAITANFMRENSFSFVPQFKLTALGNHQPTFPGGMNAAIRRRFRLMLLDFVPKVVDPDLMNVLRGEWSGILAWMIEGLVHPAWGWHQTRLSTPKVVSDATDAYVHDQDGFGLWLEERVEKSPGTKSSSPDLYADWTDWRHANNLSVATNPNAFALEMDGRGFKRTHLKTGNVFLDIRLKSKAKSVF